jgi:hypothetical protein
MITLLLFLLFFNMDRLFAMEVDPIVGGGFEPYYLKSEDSEDKIIIPKQYGSRLNERFKNIGKDELKLPFPKERVQNIAAVLLDLYKNKTLHAIKRCQQNPMLFNTLDHLGFDTSEFEEISFWSNDIKKIPDNDMGTVNLFFKYKEELEKLEANLTPNLENTPACLSSCTHGNPYQILLIKRPKPTLFIKNKDQIVQSNDLAFINYDKVESIEIAPHGHYWIAKDKNQLFVFESSENKLKTTIELPESIQTFICYESFLEVKTEKRFSAYQIGYGHLLLYPDTKNDEPITVMARSNDGNHWVAGSRNGSFICYKSHFGELQEKYRNNRHAPNPITALIIKSDNDTVITADSTGKLTFYSLSNQRLLSMQTIGKDIAIRRIALINDEKHLLLEICNTKNKPFSPRLVVCSAQINK